MNRVIILFSTVILAATSIASAGNGASIDKGSELFKSTQLGSNGKSCNTCHPDGNGLLKAATYDEEKLAGIINRCINYSLDGKALGAKSDEMKSLLMYIKSMPPASAY